MGNPRLIVTSPLLRAATVATVQGEPDQPVVLRDRKVALEPAPLNVAIAAREAGAEVTYLGLTEPRMVSLVRSELDSHGIVADLIETHCAGLESIEYVDHHGASCFRVLDLRLPSASDVDRLIDRLGTLLERGAASVVTASDLDGADPLDFVERVIGRAWGLGVRTVTAVSGASLKQAFHALPAAAFCDERDLIQISPPPEGAQETTAETLRRIFEDSIRILLVLDRNGMLRAASREGTVELGPLGELRSEELMGALAARLLSSGDDYLVAAKRAYAGLGRAAGSTLTEVGVVKPKGKVQEASS